MTQETKSSTTLCRCNSGQHVAIDKMCDFVTDCFDASDEDDCDGMPPNLNYQTKQPPMILHFDSHGSFTQVNMNSTDPCPVTHFRCPRPVYCMPVFLRCNGVKDCPYGEDEIKCDHFSCPMYYRCRGSSVCLHPTHVCDGWPQCPQRDDELLCNATCPAVCQCQGLAFVCRQSFSLISFTELRYLDAEGSGIQPTVVSHNLYLIYLSLAACKVYSWPTVTFENLQKLDLSQNRLTLIFMQHFVFLENLRYLNLSGNPLDTMVKDSSDIKRSPLISIDLSYTHILTFDSLIFVKFASVESLNLSFSRLSTLSRETLSHLPTLKQLDLSGCDIKQFSTDMYKKLINLERIKTSDYKLCCKVCLPNAFNENYCFSPQDEVSSCRNLLRSKSHRAFIWVFCIFSVSGNAGILIYRFIHPHGSQSNSGYSIFVNSLNLSDCLMGVYLAIIGTADRFYDGQYLWYDHIWKSSTMCKIAGYFCFVSSEVSVFMISILTIDRITALHVACKRFRFTDRSAMMTSGLAWLCGLSVAAVPLLTVFSHRRVYGHTSICIPLSSQTGQVSLFGVSALFKFVLFLFIGMVQTSIFWSMKSKSIHILSSTSALLDLVLARRLFTVIVSDCLCWIPIGLLGLMEYSGLHVPSEVNVAMAIAVLPLNSAVNPFLYAFNTLKEQRRKAKEAKMLTFLRSRVKSQQCHT